MNNSNNNKSNNNITYKTATKITKNNDHKYKLNTKHGGDFAYTKYPAFMFVTRLRSLRRHSTSCTALQRLGMRSADSGNSQSNNPVTVHWARARVMMALCLFQWTLVEFAPHLFVKGSWFRC